MSKLIITKSKVGNIADSLRQKTGTQNTYTLDQMPTVIDGLPTHLINKTITENGLYNAIDDGADGYAKVAVSVSTGNEPSGIDPVIWGQIARDVYLPMIVPFKLSNVNIVYGTTQLTDGIEVQLVA